ncbi:MAG: class I SAM-dependent methyltransferase [Caulobacter sp.]|nr:class I SAM-dependent methyltransferase [Vitreoscilla sp.]
MAFCCLCEQDVDVWVPHPARTQRSSFMVLMGTVGSDLTHYACPHCGCNDRDRHLWMYMAAVGLPEQLAGARILHLAPEASLEPRLLACQPAEYVRGDLFPARSGIRRVDAEAIAFEDGRFDLIIANHLLEHVRHPERALAEFARCLAPGGLLIAQTPFAPALKHTFELDTPPSEDFAKLYYGQVDHVRLFGGDIGALFNAAGLRGALLPHAQILGDFDPTEFGCNIQEPFFAFSKPARELEAA